MDTNARAALAARRKHFDLLGPVAFVPLLKLADIRFRKHRTQQQVREDRARGGILRKLGRD